MPRLSRKQTMRRKKPRNMSKRRLNKKVSRRRVNRKKRSNRKSRKKRNSLFGGALNQNQKKQIEEKYKELEKKISEELPSQFYTELKEYMSAHNYHLIVSHNWREGTSILDKVIKKYYQDSNEADSSNYLKLFKDIAESLIDKQCIHNRSCDDVSMFLGELSVRYVDKGEFDASKKQGLKEAFISIYNKI